MFHLEPNSLRKSYLNSIITIIFLLFALNQRGQSAEKFYDPAKGFKPAQSSLTDIMLQLAGSLEHHGSPEPYIRHVIAEHKRIDAKYAKATGKTKGSSRPAYLTDEKVEILLNNWKRIEKPLQFNDMCRKCGVYMRHAIQGSWNKTPDELVAEEKNLNKQQRARYRNLLGKKYFKRSDLPEVEKFYADGGGWDQLSEDGKNHIGMRTELGMSKPEHRKKYWKSRDGGTMIINLFNEYQDKYMADKTDKVNSDTLEQMLIQRLKLNEKNPSHAKLKWIEQDAVKYSYLIKGEFQKRFDFVDGKLSPDGAAKVRRSMKSMAENLLVIAHSELIARIRENVADHKLKQ